MANNIREFSTMAEYSAATLVTPAVSLITATSGVVYNQTQPTPPTPSFQGKFRAVYEVGGSYSAECDSSTALTQADVNPSGYESITELEVGGCIKKIDDYLCDEVNSLTSLTINNGVEEIGELAFDYIYLTGVTIPDSVTTIGHRAFDHDSDMEYVTIGSGITEIGYEAFFCCHRLTAITITATTPPTLEVGGDQFTSSECPIYVPASSVSAYQTALGWSDYASRIQAIPNT